MDANRTVVKDLFGLMVEAEEAESSSDGGALIEEARAAMEQADAPVRRAVERLLAAHRRAAGVLLESKPGDSRDTANNRPFAYDTSPDSPRIAGYEIADEIGRGGFGVVYRARQLHPVERPVAVKILRTELATQEVIARFRAESRVLARMNHAGIARVLDAGLDAQRRPYVTMELVNGEPLVAYCESHSLTIRERVRLMIEVCEAVHHAHQRAVVHRDLKPANILVEQIDARHQPRVIDFGIAKMLEGNTDETRTHEGARLGTPRYMSPEQAGGTDSADVRSDVYALGVLLCEALTNQVPRDPAGTDEASGLRPKTRATRPSQLAASGEPEIALRSRELRGDLDRIVLKAVALEPNQRYDSAAALAEDLQRYLDGLPVHATAPSVIYLTRKFIARRKVTSAAMLLAMLSIIGGMTAAMYGIARANESRMAAEAALVEAERERARAEQREQEAAAAREDEHRQRELVERRERELRTIADFQSAMISRINAEHMGQSIAADFRGEVARSLQRSGVDQLVIDKRMRWLDAALADINMTNIAVHAIDENMLGLAMEAIDNELADQPTIQAALLLRVAHTYTQIGRLDAALVLTARAVELNQTMLGERHPETLDAQYTHGTTLLLSGRLGEARMLFEHTLRIVEEVHGADHIEMYVGMSSLAKVLEAQGSRQEAAELFVQSAEGLRRHLGDDHPETLSAINNVGFILRQLGRDQEALPYLELALDGRRRRNEPDDANTLMTVANVAALLQAAGRLDEAESRNREAVDGFRRMYGDENHLTLTVMNNLATVLSSRQKYDEAAYWGRLALDGRERTLGADHPDTIQSYVNHATLLMRMERYDQAERFVLDALDGYEKSLDASHPRRLNAMRAYGVILRRTDRLEEAESVLTEGLAHTRQRLGDTHTYTAHYLRDLGSVQVDLQNFPAAEANFLQSLGLMEQRRPMNVQYVRNVLQALIDLHDRWHLTAPDAGHDARSAQYREREQSLQ